MPIPDPALPDVWQVRIGYSYLGESMVNVLHVLDTTGTADADTVLNKIDQGLEDALNDATTGTPYRAIINNSLTINNVKVVRYDEASPDVAEVSHSGAPWIGTNTSDSMPGQIAIALTLRTTLASRRYRGRIFLPGWSTAQQTDQGLIQPGVGATIEAFWSDVFGEWATGPPILAIGVLSRGWVNEGVNDPRESYAQSWVPLDSIAVRNNSFDTMRSRGAAN